MALRRAFGQSPFNAEEVDDDGDVINVRWP
jgi:hypothetical protein